TTNTNYVDYQTGLTGTSYTTGPLTGGHVYRLWGWAVGDTGKSSPFSALLFTAAPALTPPVLTAPAPDSMVGNTPTINWQAVAGAAGYRLRLDDYSANNNYVLFLDHLTQTSYTTGALTAGHTYRLWLWAEDAAGNLGPDTAILFTVSA